MFFSRIERVFGPTKADLSGAYSIKLFFNLIVHTRRSGLCQTEIGNLLSLCGNATESAQV